MADQANSKKRTFRKFTFRGVDLEGDLRVVDALRLGAGDEHFRVTDHLSEFGGVEPSS